MELLLALSLGALILAQVTGLLFVAERSRRRTAEACDRELRVAAAVRLLAADLACLQRTPLPDRPAFAAPTPGLSQPPFLRLHTQGRPGRPAQTIDYFLVPDPALDRPLVRRSQATGDPSPRGPEAGAGPPSGAADHAADWEVMLTGVQSWRWRYFDGAQWHDQWTDPAAWPRLVELTLEMEDAQRPQRFREVFELLPGRVLNGEASE